MCQLTADAGESAPALPHSCIPMASPQTNPIYERVRHILDAAQAGVARSVNSAQVIANWRIGQEIVEEEQRGKGRAGYGERLMHELAERLRGDYGAGYGLTNLKLCRKFYLLYAELLAVGKGHAPRDFSAVAPDAGAKSIGHAVRDLLPTPEMPTWQPGRFHSNLSWTHYRTLLRVELSPARAFYEVEALKTHWSARELERQINSLLYERLAKSRNKAGVLKLATQGHEIQTPLDIFKDPMVIEFLGLPESPRLVESDLETALITHLQTFMLELGKGFAFVARQKRITIDGDHFYIDLVFYHVILKCYVLVDLKMAKLTHGDLGQLQLYVNYFDREVCSPGDNPTLGLVLCTDKNDAVVKYTLGPEQQAKIFTSRYELHLPTEAELQTEIRQELKQLRGTRG